MIAQRRELSPTRPRSGPRSPARARAPRARRPHRRCCPTPALGRGPDGDRARRPRPADGRSAWRACGPATPTRRASLLVAAAAGCGTPATDAAGRSPSRGRWSRRSAGSRDPDGCLPRSRAWLPPDARLRAALLDAHPARLARAARRRRGHLRGSTGLASDLAAADAGRRRRRPGRPAVAACGSAGRAGRRSPTRVGARCGWPTGASSSPSPAATWRRAGPARGDRGAGRPGRAHPAGGARARRRRAARRRRPPCRLAVIALGKTGGRELNYVSDVDVVFVAEPGRHDADVAERVDAALAHGDPAGRGDVMRICREAAWEVDAGAAAGGQGRPAGAHAGQPRGLLPSGGPAPGSSRRCSRRGRSPATPSSAAAYVDALGRWCGRRRSGRTSSTTCRPCAAGSSRTCPPAIAERELKLGRGRPARRRVRRPAAAARARPRRRVAAGPRHAAGARRRCRDGGYVGRDDAVSLIDAYRFLRAVEHRLQLRRLRRTHLLPDDAAAAALAGPVAWATGPTARGDARAVLRGRVALHAREVRRLHEKLFYRPLLEAVARVPAEQLRLTPAEAGRLAAPRWASPTRTRALRHIEALTAGLSPAGGAAAAPCCRCCSSDFADAPDPDAGLLAYRQVSEALGGDAVVPAAAARRGTGRRPGSPTCSGTSRYVARMLGRAPEALRMLGRRRRAAAARPRPSSPATMAEAAARQDDAVDAVRRGARAAPAGAAAHRVRRPARPARRRSQVVPALSATTEATLEAALQVARGPSPRRAASTHAAVASSRSSPWAGSAAPRSATARTPTCCSCTRPSAPTSETRPATRLAQRGRRQAARAAVGAPSSTDPPLGVDADLRPEGRNGPLVRVAGLLRALLRALVVGRGRRRRCCGRGSVAGDAGAGRDGSSS